MIYGVLNFQKLQGDTAHYVSQSELVQAKHNKQIKKPSFDYGAVVPVSPKTLAYAYAHRRDYRAIGQIAINRYNVDLNIYRGIGNVELNLGVGTMNPNEEMGKGNYALAGHNMDDGRSYFSPLYTAKARNVLASGTAIYVTDFTNVYYYSITEADFIAINRTDLVDNKPEFNKQPVISLFTCDWTGRGRLFIRGKLTGSQKLTSASKAVQDSFK